MTIPLPDNTVASCVAAPRLPLDGFSPEEFRARRNALRAACPEGIVVVRGAVEAEFSRGARYMQNSSFYYLSGVDTPGAYLVLLPEGVPPQIGVGDTPPTVREILFLPARNAGAETWTGAKLVPEVETEASTGIAKTASASAFLPALTAWIRRRPAVFTLMPFGAQATLTREHALVQEIASCAPAARFHDTGLALARLRVTKSPAEIERIRRAVAITNEGQRAARALITRGAGRREYEVEAAIFEAFRRNGAWPGFGTIVGAGINATVLHYEDNCCALTNGDAVVVDIGACTGHYSGDVTRTYPVGGTFSPRQRELYQLVLEAHNRTITDYRPGVDTLQDINDRCKELLKRSPLRALTPDGAEQTMDLFMPHRLSHHLGLDVHDLTALIGSAMLGVYGDDGSELPLAPGAVITVEPGIYVPSEGIGIRIEDDYLVTASGLESLDSSLERDIDAVEARIPRRKGDASKQIP